MKLYKILHRLVITTLLSTMIFSQDITVSPASLDFGSVTIGENSSLNLTINNNTSTLLNITNINADDNQFYAPIPVVNIAGYSSAEIEIIYIALTNGLSETTLHLETNFESQPVVDVPCSGSGSSTISGEISGIWSIANSPYSIVGDVIIPNGATLTIDPGVKIAFDGDYEFRVEGSLIAHGDEEGYIYFYGAGDEKQGYITLVNTDNEPFLLNCKFENLRGIGGEGLIDNFEDGLWSDNWYAEYSDGTVGTTTAYSHTGLYSFLVYAANQDRAAYTIDLAVGSSALLSLWYKITTSEYLCNTIFYWRKNGGGWTAFLSTPNQTTFDWTNVELDLSGSVEIGDIVSIRVFSNINSDSNDRDQQYTYIDDFAFVTDNPVISVYNSNLTLNNCLLINNSGGLFSDSSLNLNYCTIAFNSSIGVSLVGNYLSSINNSIIWSNDILNFVQFMNQVGIVISNYSNIQGYTSYGIIGNGEFVFGDGMIDSNPLFINEDATLSETSFSVDSAAPWDQDAYMPPGLGSIAADMGSYGGPNNGAWSGESIPEGEPTIDNIVDIPQDQGGFAGIQYSASIFDYEHTAYNIAEYSFWRELDVEGSAEGASTNPNNTERLITSRDEYWEKVGEMDAQGFENYGYTAPTLADSTSDGNFISTFLVIAHTDSDDIYFVSDPASGHSIDNLAPEVPELFSGEFNDGQINLLWSGSVDDDFAHFNIYRNGELYSTALDSEFVDIEIPNIPEVYYSISSMDHSGNESEASPELMVQAMIMGDMNGDFTLNVLDLVLMMEFILQIGEIENFTQADLNEDGVVDVLDIVILVNIILDNNDMSRVSTEAKVYQSSKSLKHSSSGDIAYHITLGHADDFTLTLTEDAFAARFNTVGTLTEMIIINPESDILFTTDDEFSITEIKAASGNSYIKVDIVNLPESFSLSQAYPNPFNPVTSFSYGLPSEANLSIKVYDIQGRLIETLYDGLQSAGFHQLSWNADNQASGLYIIRVVDKSDAEIYSSQQKLMLLK